MDQSNNWVKEFFNQPNQWDWEKIVNASYGEKLNRLLHEMLSSSINENLPAILPRLDRNKKLWFYVLGKDYKQLMELRGIIAAYLGGVYIDLKDMLYQSPRDELEKIVITHSPEGFLCLKIHKSDKEERNNKDQVFWIFETLNKIIQQYNDRPLILSTVRRPTGRILRDFFTSYDRHDYKSSITYYEELENQQLLSQRNLIYLKIQSFAVGGMWGTILGHPNLPDVLTGRVPKRINSLVLKSLRETTLNPEDFDSIDIENVGDQLEYLDRYFSKVPNLSKSINDIDDWKCWSIGAATFGFARVLDVLPDNVDIVWRQKLKKWAKLEHSVDSPSLDTLLNEFESFDLAIRLFQEMISASEEEKLRIYNRINEFSEEIKSEIFKNITLKAIFDSIKEDDEYTNGYQNWTELFLSLSSNQGPVDILALSENLDFWEKDSWSESDLINLLNNSNSDNSNFRDILPLIIEWLKKQDIHLSPDCTVLLLEDLGIDDCISIQDLNLCLSLLEPFLSNSHSKKHYIDAIDALETCWDKVKSQQSLDFMFEIFDLLIDAPCANNNKRESLWVLFQSYLINNWIRLDNQQQMVALQLANDLLGTIDQFPERVLKEVDREEFDEINISGKKLAIYTLTEGAGRRAKNILEGLYPGLHIFLNHDKSLTSALDNLIKTVDYFIFTSRSAAHQAYYPASKKRDDLIYPNGKGSSSIVRAFSSFLKIHFPKNN